MSAQRPFRNQSTVTPDRTRFEMYLDGLVRHNLAPAVLGGASLEFLLDSMQVELPSIRYSRVTLRRLVKQELRKLRCAQQESDATVTP